MGDEDVECGCGGEAYKGCWVLVIEDSESKLGSRESRYKHFHVYPIFHSPTLDLSTPHQDVPPPSIHRPSNHPARQLRAIPRRKSKAAHPQPP